MKRVRIVALVAVLVAGLGTAALAQDSSEGGEKKLERAGRGEAKTMGRFLLLHNDGVGLKRDGTTVEVRTQKGIIEAVDADFISLKSPDGYRQTYAINGETRVREKKQPSSPADLKAGEMARVVALKEGNGYTAKLINCTGEPGPRLKELLSKAR